jgi:hypothetical protein
MRRSLVLRRDVLADLTPSDLAGVVGGQQQTIPCYTERGCQALAVIRNWLEQQSLMCPVTQGCPPAP